MFSIDTRTINEGDVFVALNGDNFNGHDFVEEAFEKGASAAIVEENRNYKLTNEQLGKLILTEDSLQSLTEIAIDKRSKSDAIFIGITGSVGKTSTKEMLYHTLRNTEAVYATIGNFNNHIGLPLCLANMPSDIKYAIFEIGMSGGGEIDALTNILQPDIAILTAISPAHMANFNDLREVAEEKCDIFKHAKTSIFPADIKYLDIVLSRSSHTNQVIAPDNDYNNLTNSNLIIATLNELGLAGNVDELKTYTPPKGRGSVINIKDNIKLIDDSYNASPDSMRLAISNLALEEGRKVAILGDMLELGVSSAYYHKELAPLIIEAGIDKVICVGDEVKALYNELPLHVRSGLYDDVDELIDNFNIANDSTVLVKGSNSIGLNKLVENISKN